jgi:hypothetical protein
MDEVLDRADDVGDRRRRLRIERPVVSFNVRFGEGEAAVLADGGEAEGAVAADAGEHDRHRPFSGLAGEGDEEAVDRSPPSGVLAGLAQKKPAPVERHPRAGRGEMDPAGFDGHTVRDLDEVESARRTDRHATLFGQVLAAL